MDYAEAYTLAQKSLKTAGDQAALHRWNEAEKACIAALAYLYDLKLSVIEHKQRQSI